MKVREDQILFLLSSKLKDLATTFGIFIFSSTQINGSFKHEQILDQTVLSGAKSIANRVDVGAVMVDATEEDLEPIKELIPYYGTPNMKMSIYKNRRGEYNRVFLWMRADKSTCRYKTLFVTDYNYNIIDGILDKRKIEEAPQGEDGENVVF